MLEPYYFSNDLSKSKKLENIASTCANVARWYKSHFIYMSAAVLSNTSTKNQPTKSSSMVNCLGQIK